MLNLKQCFADPDSEPGQNKIADPMSDSTITFSKLKNFIFFQLVQYLTKYSFFCDFNELCIKEQEL